MAKVTITLEDVDLEAGQFQASVLYEPGFDRASSACVLGHRLMQHLDTLANREGQETIVGDAPSGHAPEHQDLSGNMETTVVGLPAIANTTLPNADSMPGMGNH